MVLRLKQPTSSDTSFPGLVWLGSLFSPVEVDIEHRLIVEGLIQQQVVPLDKYWPTHIPDEYLWMMVAAVAHASGPFTFGIWEVTTGASCRSLPQPEALALVS